jgi:imidazolonepropionase-like amidohydrolase
MLGLLLSVAPLAPPAPVPATYAFVNVNVIPMDRERVLSGQTVVVRGDRIIALGSAAAVKVPAGAIRIDGAGKFLIPGLAEMHAHIPPGPTVADSTIERVLALYALTGITTIRGMLGDPRHLPLRARVAKGELLSPWIYTSAPSLNAGTVPTGKDAIDSVTKYQRAGYDFLKIHPGIKRGVYDTLVATANRVHIRWAGHVPLEVGIEHAIETHYWSVDHLDGYIEGLVPHQGAFTTQEDGFFGLPLAGKADESRIAGLARKTKAAGVWVVPTETLMRHVVGDYSTADMAKWPEMKYWPESGVADWTRMTEKGFRGDTASSPEIRHRYLELRKKLITGLHAAGVGFLLGSDSPQIWNVPGFSIRRELAYVVDAGLTPYQALESGTKNVAEFFGTLPQTGTIAVGKRADLVLLDGNPLTDIGNVGSQAGVMVRGRWLAKEEIATQLAKLARP